jgi:GTP cyclohydrolase II
MASSRAFAPLADAPSCSGRPGHCSAAAAARAPPPPRAARAPPPPPRAPRRAPRAPQCRSASSAPPGAGDAAGAGPPPAPAEAVAAAAEWAAQQQHQPRQGDARAWTKFVAETLLPTEQGKFRLRGYRHTADGGATFTEPSAIISGAVEGAAGVLVRVHDACFTSEVLGSLKCDCREQLRLALATIRAEPPGLVIYLQQEGRGIGLANKIAAYALQERGLDTVDANRALGLPDDAREYSAVAHILADLGVASIRLMTNNPRKLERVAALGVAVNGRVPCVVRPQALSRGYLAAKQQRMEHLFSDEELSEDEGPAAAGAGEAAEPLAGQFCFVDHEGEPGPRGPRKEAPVPVACALSAAEAAAAARAAEG